MLETLSGGHWDSVKPPLPADADTSGSADISDLSCPTVGTCVATGWYINQAGDREPEIDTLSGGTWTATAAPVPADAATTSPLTGLWAVGCPAPGTCLAGGHYQNRSGQLRYLIDRLSGGAWTAAALPLPADAAANQQWSQYGVTTVGGLACASAGYCVATAGYLTKTGEIVPLIETLSRGTWTAVKAPLPTDGITGSGQGDGSYLQLATCPAPDSCLTVGSYPSADGTTEGMIETASPQHG